MPYSEPASPKPPLHKFPVCDSSKVDDWSAATLPVFGPVARDFSSVRLRMPGCRNLALTLNCPSRRVSALGIYIRPTLLLYPSRAQASLQLRPRAVAA